MKTQTQHFRSSHNVLADRMSFFDWLGKQENGPSSEELQKLRAKNPNWKSFPEKLAR
jgi:hypothetical protein